MRNSTMGVAKVLLRTLATPMHWLQFMCERAQLCREHLGRQVCAGGWVEGAYCHQTSSAIESLRLMWLLNVCCYHAVHRLMSCVALPSVWAHWRRSLMRSKQSCQSQHKRTHSKTAAWAPRQRFVLDQLHERRLLCSTFCNSWQHAHP